LPDRGLGRHRGGRGRLRGGLGFALYAAVRDFVGPAWAAAAVAGAVALMALILALLLTRKARPKAVKGDGENLTARLIELARERPWWRWRRWAPPPPLWCAIRAS